MNYKVEVSGLHGLAAKVKRLKATPYDHTVKKNTTEMFNRAAGRGEGGTPFKSGELRLSRFVRFEGNDGIFGYTKDYGPHVNYGHRTRNGGWVPGQHFIDKNLEIQRPIFKQDLLDLLKGR